MTCIGFLSVAPVIEGSMSSYVADAVAALEAFDVEYETTPMGTIIEAEDSKNCSRPPTPLTRLSASRPTA